VPATEFGLLSVTPLVPPLQIVASPDEESVGTGFTVMVNACGVPGQVTLLKIYCGVTVMVAITGTEPAFTAVKGAMFPDPLAARPIVGSSLTHV
jgi:hypothetical protein